MCCRITENVWKNSGFLRSKKGLLCTPHLVCSFFKFISHIFQRESDKKYIQFILATIRFSWLRSPIQTFDFPTILSQLPMPLQLWRVLWKAFMISIGHTKSYKINTTIIWSLPFLRTVVFDLEIHLPWLLCLIKSFSSINRSWSESSSQNLQ